MGHRRSASQALRSYMLQGGKGVGGDLQSVRRLPVLCPEGPRYVPQAVHAGPSRRWLPSTLYAAFTRSLYDICSAM